MKKFKQDIKTLLGSLKETLQEKPNELDQLLSALEAIKHTLPDTPDCNALLVDMKNNPKMFDTEVLDTTSAKLKRLLSSLNDVKPSSDTRSSLKAYVETPLSPAVKEVLENIDNDSVVYGGALTVHDLSIPYAHMFSPAAKKGLSRRVESVLPKRTITTVGPSPGLPGMEVIDSVQYFSIIVKGEEKIVKAARIITELLNKLAAKGYITGCLSPLSFISLPSESHELPTYAVYCWPVVTLDGVSMLEEEKPVFHVGEGQPGYVL
jgi:hypothetical protein